VEEVHRRNHRKSRPHTYADSNVRRCEDPTPPEPWRDDYALSGNEVLPGEHMWCAEYPRPGGTYDDRAPERT